MFIAAIKCDFCQKAHEIPCRKSGDVPKVPDGWAIISPVIRIQGTPGDPTCGGKEWNTEAKAFNKAISQETKQKLETKKLYTKRRDELRKRFDKSHVCEDCIEEVLTGRRSVKIGMGETQ